MKNECLDLRPYCVSDADLSERVAEHLLSLDEKEFDKTIKLIHKGIRKARKRLERKIKYERIS